MPSLPSSASASLEHSQQTLDAYLWASAARGDMLGIDDAIELGANPKARTGSGLTSALMRASGNGHLAAALRLMPLSNLDALCDSGKSAVHRAVAGAHADCLLALADAGANVNLCSKRSEAPIVNAMRLGALSLRKESNPDSRSRCVDILMEIADLNAKDLAGNNLSTIAKQHDLHDFARLIKARAAAQSESALIGKIVAKSASKPKSLAL